MENAQTAWGIELPFTTTKLIFSYDVETMARENAEVIIRAFFSGVYDLNEYTVEFVDE